MKRRVLALALALAMVLVMVPALADEGENGETQPVESIKKRCTKCHTQVDSVGLCTKCASAQDNTQQVVMPSYEAPVANSDESGDNTGSTGSGSVSTDSSSSTTGNDGGNNDNGSGNNDNGSGNTGSESGDNTGSTGSGSVSTDSSSSTTGNDGGNNDNGSGNNDNGSGNTGSESGNNTGGGSSNTGGGSGSTGSESGDGETTPTTDCTHAWSAPTWAWSADYSVASATFTCTKTECSKSEIKQATVTTSTEYSGCYVYTKYTATVTGPDEKGYSDSQTTNCRRSDWYYDRTYYTPCRPVWCDTSYTACGPCGHWGCGNVCTRYSSCTPCKNYTPTFRVGGYSCLATPKTGDASVIAPAMLALIGAAGAVLGKKRK